MANVVDALAEAQRKAPEEERLVAEVSTPVFRSRSSRRLTTLQTEMQKAAEIGRAHV